MATVLYNDAYQRAQELRERLDRMREWFDANGGSGDLDGLRWRRERFEAVQREYQELLQILRACGKPSGGGGQLTAEETGYGQHQTDVE